MEIFDGEKYGKFFKTESRKNIFSRKIASYKLVSDYPGFQPVNVSLNSFESVMNKNMLKLKEPGIILQFNKDLEAFTLPMVLVTMKSSGNIKHDFLVKDSYDEAVKIGGDMLLGGEGFIRIDVDNDNIYIAK